MQNNTLRCPVWAKGLTQEKNITLAFTYNYHGKVGDKLCLTLSASNIYRLFVGDTLVGYGPARAAHGYARVDEYSFVATAPVTPITVEVSAYNMNTYYVLLEEPFFDCALYCNEKLEAVSNQFICYRLDDRVQKTQRYSFQRGCIEVYSRWDRAGLYNRERITYPLVELQSVTAKTYLPRGVKYPLLNDAPAPKLFSKGCVELDDGLPIWKDRCLNNIGKDLLGFTYEELDDKTSDYVSQFSYQENKTGNTTYCAYVFPHIVTGLIDVTLRVKEDAEVYFVFDEVMVDKDGEVSNAIQDFHFYRNDCANMLKYALKKGEYRLTSFEIYTLQYLFIACMKGAVEIVSANVIAVESGEQDTFVCKIEDEQLQSIMDSALRSYKQNSLDVLMDCPSRERAGWTNDAYFSSSCDKLFTGTRTVEKNYLENILLAPDLGQIPSGMVPMCYPADHLNGDFIPNCAVWYMLELHKYYAVTRDPSLKTYIEKRTRETMAYFDTFLNEDGLLENLKGWVFIDWSDANSAEFTCGVNYPSNMMYYKFIKDAGEFFNDDTLRARAQDMKASIIRQSFNGKYFEDNAVRENGKLTLKGHTSEACQYYAFWFGVADMDTHKALFDTLAEDYGVEKQGQNTELRHSNMISGYTLRLDLLMARGDVDKIISECKQTYCKMANATGTLWEHKTPTKSCNHNVTSYVAVWLIYALTGYKGVIDGKVVMDRITAKINCVFCFYHEDKTIEIVVDNGNVTVKTALPVHYV